MNKERQSPPRNPCITVNPLGETPPWVSLRHFPNLFVRAIDRHRFTPHTLAFHVRGLLPDRKLTRTDMEDAYRIAVYQMTLPGSSYYLESAERDKEMAYGSNFSSALVASSHIVGSLRGRRDSIAMRMVYPSGVVVAAERRSGHGEKGKKAEHLGTMVLADEELKVTVHNTIKDIRVMKYITNRSTAITELAEDFEKTFGYLGVTAEFSS